MDIQLAFILGNIYILYPQKTHQRMQMTEIQIEPNKVEDYVKFEAVPQQNSFQCKITTLPHQASNEVNHVNNICLLYTSDAADE